MALALPQHEVDADGTVLEGVAESRTVRTFVGEPLLVNFDGGHSQGVGTTGFSVTGRDGVILLRGEYDVGCTNNHAEALAALHALQAVV